MPSQIHARYIRYREFSRLRHSTLFLQFLGEQATRLTGTGAATAFTADATGDTIAVTDHGLVDGDGPYVLENSGGALPAGLAVDTLYWVSAPTTGTLQLHTSMDDAVEAINPVDITDAGTGTHTFLAGANAETIFNAMKDGLTADQVRGLTDIDNL